MPQPDAQFGKTRPSQVPGRLVDAPCVSVWERASGNVEEYLRVFGSPEQLAAWRENRPYVAEVTA
ncbi:hypothetical protein AB0N16_36060 [Streptomyces sp. NPDC051105]|uniref:hypothetical protein n=1 Tax=Streptomyces sp. NPDC051105 TaxID=3154843 RepID=UPI00343CCC93